MAFRRQVTRRAGLSAGHCGHVPDADGRADPKPARADHPDHDRLLSLLRYAPGGLPHRPAARLVATSAAASLARGEQTKVVVRELPRVPGPQDPDPGLTLTNLCSIIDQMGRTPAETRRISPTRPRLSVATRVSERWPPEGPRGLEGRARAPVPGLPEATRAASPDAATSNFSNLGVRSAASEASTGILPVLPVLRELMPRGGLPRGSVVTVAEFGLLALALAAGASAAGAWCGIAGVPEAGVLAAAALGLEAERTLLVPDPGHAWAQVVASLLDGCELVLLRLPARRRPRDPPASRGPRGSRRPGPAAAGGHAAPRAGRAAGGR